MESDAVLYRDAVAGDRQAFGQIVERYQNLICSLAFSTLGDIGRSEDAAQETFITAWKKLADLREPEKLRAWLCGIVRNCTANMRRRQISDVTVRAAVLNVESDAASVLDHPVDRAIRAEEQQLLWNVLETMPPQYREPLVLYYRSEQSVAEVAAQLDLTEDSVKQRLSRGRKLLKTEVAAFVEKALRDSRPRKVFGIAVLAALPATAPQAMATTLGATGAKSAAVKAAAATTSLAGIILGPLLGTLGAALGIKAGLESTKHSPRQHRLTLLMLLPATALIVLLMATQFIGIRFFPQTYRTAPFQIALWGSYTVALLALIVWGNRRLRQIRIEEGEITKDSSSCQSAMDMPPRAVKWMLAGTMFGALSWVVTMGFVMGDQAVAIGAVAFALVAWFLLGRWIETTPRPENRVLAVAIGLATVGILDVGFTSLRWSTWKALPTGQLARRIDLWMVNTAIAAIVVPLVAMLLWQYRRAKHMARPRTQQPSSEEF